MTSAAVTDFHADRPARRDRRGFARFVMLLLLAVLAFRTFLYTPFSIPSESMLPALAEGDYLVAAKWPYGYSRWSLPFDAPLFAGTIAPSLPERGDIAVFRHPVDRTEYIKRVIGLPGDRVELREGQVILGGVPVTRQRAADLRRPLAGNDADCEWGAAQDQDAAGARSCRYARYTETLPSGRSYAVLDLGVTPQDRFGPVTVPPGHVFVLGDNRDNSQDSRFEARAGGGLGMVPVDLLVGRFETVLFSTAGWPSWLTGSRRGTGRRL